MHGGDFAGSTPAGSTSNMKNCNYLTETATMDGTDYDCEHPVFKGDCDGCPFGGLAKESAEKKFEALELKALRLYEEKENLKDELAEVQEKVGVMPTFITLRAIEKHVADYHYVYLGASSVAAWNRRRLRVWLEELDVPEEEIVKFFSARGYVLPSGDKPTEISKDIRKAENDIKTWCNKHTYLDTSLFTSKLLDELRDPVAVAKVLFVLDEVCHDCWNNEPTCQCANDD